MKMKKTLLAVFPLLLSFFAYAQYEVGFGLGSSMLVKKPADVDVQSALNVTGYIQREFRFSPKFIFEPRLSFISGRYFVDGTFSKNANGETVFSKMPDTYKQNRLQITSIRVPLFLKYEFFKNHRGEGIAIGAGPYFEYVTSVRQIYKLSNNNYSDPALINNRFQAGLGIDFGTSGKVVKSNRLAFGGGIQYQLTEYLDNNPSFKPLIFHLRLGYRF
jgi:hypothetical protein